MDETSERPRSYTKAQILQAAREAGFSPTDRLFTDWISLGLLDQSDRRGLGRGKGTIATWSEEQLQLFLLLLAKRPQVRRIATLSNIPVGIWLRWGSPYVEAGQARRALSTWAGRSERVSWRRARWTAEELTGRFAHEDATASARTQLVKAIAEAAYGRPFRGDELLRLFRAAFDPHNSGRSVGPAWLNMTPHAFVLLTEVRLNAVAALQHDELGDTAFEWARTEYRESRPRHEQLELSLASDPEASDLFLKRSPQGVLLPTTFEDVFNRSCIDLLTLLGFYLHRKRSPEP